MQIILVRQDKRTGSDEALIGGTVIMWMFERNEELQTEIARTFLACNYAIREDRVLISSWAKLSLIHEPT